MELPLQIFVSLVGSTVGDEVIRALAYDFTQFTFDEVDLGSGLVVVGVVTITLFVTGLGSAQ